MDDAALTRKRGGIVGYDETAGKVLSDSKLQLFAVTFLLCAPSVLQDKWIETGSAEGCRQLLSDLGFTDVEAAIAVMKQLNHRRTLFRGLGELIGDLAEYSSEPPPHPNFDDAQALVMKLK
jgi:hypothetical protein